MSDPDRTYNTAGPECPYCNHVIAAYEPHYYDESRYEDDECPRCEKKFTVEVSHTVAWACEPIEEPEPVTAPAES